MSQTLIFDIGKTNKKIFIFEADLTLVHSESHTFPERLDEDGFPCDDIQAISNWLITSFEKYIHDKTFDIQGVNISAYGASMVYLDPLGKVLTPLYNYLKSYPPELLNTFHQKYGHPMKVARETASPPLQMLNSGLQIYRLKYTQSQVFDKVRWALHLPQYFSFLLTGKALSEYTSIGCHTGLWNYESKVYHHWVIEEKIDRILPPIVSSYQYVEREFANKKVQIGVGIHDSSAALIPYMRKAAKTFALLSTGTWCISLNPYTHEGLREEDLQQDCLHFLRPDGGTVRAARLFLGNEYKLQVEKICARFDRSRQAANEMSFVESLYQRLEEAPKPLFRFDSICPKRLQPQQTLWDSFSSFEEAYHRLILELVKEQVKSLDRATGNTHIEVLYLDGGFAGNKVFVNILSKQYSKVSLNVSDIPVGAALGAAMALRVHT
ncbi:MAG: FGGY family carbohydrate kinase [Bacteroidota bacterium]